MDGSSDRDSSPRDEQKGSIDLVENDILTIPLSFSPLVGHGLHDHDEDSIIGSRKLVVVFFLLRFLFLIKFGFVL